jgi:hypothetical protein
MGRALAPTTLTLIPASSESGGFGGVMRANQQDRRLRQERAFGRREKIDDKENAHRRRTRRRNACRRHGWKPD